MSKTPSGHIYRHALEFYNLTIPAFSSNEILIASPNAVVCNLALCVELLLKCCDSGVKTIPHQQNQFLSDGEIYSNLKGGGHDLYAMFNRMNPDISRTLVTLYKETTGEELEPMLIKCKDYFIHARYAYEKNSASVYNISSIKQLADGLIQAICKGWG